MVRTLGKVGDMEASHRLETAPRAHASQQPGWVGGSCVGTGGQLGRSWVGVGWKLGGSWVESESRGFATQQHVEHLQMWNRLTQA